MWTKIFEFTKDILTLQRDTQQNKADIKETEQEIKQLHLADEKLRSDFNNLVLLVQQLSFDIEHIDQREQGERACSSSGGGSGLVKRGSGLSLTL